MKKFIIGLAVFVVFILILLSQFGVQIGNVRIGKQINLVTKQDKNFENSDFYKNQYSSNSLTVLNLWATWCVPCVGEMPELNKIQASFKEESINFVSLSVDKDSVKLVKFLQKDKFKFEDITLKNLTFRNAILNSLENKKPDEWISSTSVPITYLIKNKKILHKINGQIEKGELEALINKYK